MKHWPTVGFALLAPLLAATVAPARAAVVVEDQKRQLDVSAEWWGHDNTLDEDVPRFRDADSVSSTDPGTFDQSISVGDTTGPRGSASQLSTISPTQFRADGRVSVYSASD